MTLARVPLEPPAGRKARQTYDALVAATRSVLAETGTCSAEAVAERAGVAPATFYAYFSSKDDALASAFDQVLAENNDRLSGALSIERLLDKGLPTVLHAAAVEAIDAFRDNVLIFRAALARLSESKVIRDVYRQRERDGLDVIRRFIELGVAAGRLRAGDRDDIATAALVTFQGYNNAVLLHRSDDDPVVTRLVGMLEHLLAG